MKRSYLLVLLVIVISATMLIGCEELDRTTGGEQTPKATEETSARPEYVNGLYRGSYGDEVVIRFSLKDDIITDIRYQTLTHRGTNYRELQEGHPLYPVLQQQNQILEYLKQKPISAIDDLYNPGNFVDDIDGFSGATIRGSKVISAMRDALNRGVYTPDDVNDVAVNDTEYENGSYRGYFEGQVTIWFDLVDNTFSNFRYRVLSHAGNDYLKMQEGDPLYPVVLQHDQLIAHLEGKLVSAINDLYTPANFVDDMDSFSGATIRSSKIISAINDALNRGPYKPGEGFSKKIAKYEDGRYRGFYEDQVMIQFNLENGNITKPNYRLLSHAGNDYLKMEEGTPLYSIYLQHVQILNYLEGKPLSAIFDLYTPGDFITDVDTFSGATIRGGKVFSAFRDALNRGIY